MLPAHVARDDHDGLPEPRLLPALRRRPRAADRRRPGAARGAVVRRVRRAGPSPRPRCRWVRTTRCVPAMAGIRGSGTYHAVLATPVRVAELVLGTMGWAAIRVFSAAVIFTTVAAVGGAVLSPLAILAPFAALLVGLAFNADRRLLREPRGRRRRMVPGPGTASSDSDVPPRRHVLPGVAAAELARAGGGDSALERRRALPDADHRRRGRAPRGRARRLPARVRGRRRVRRDPDPPRALLK